MSSFSSPSKDSAEPMVEPSAATTGARYGIARHATTVSSSNMGMRTDHPRLLWDFIRSALLGLPAFGPFTHHLVNVGASLVYLTQNLGASIRVSPPRSRGQGLWTPLDQDSESTSGGASSGHVSEATAASRGPSRPIRRLVLATTRMRRSCPLSGSSR